MTSSAKNSSPNNLKHRIRDGRTCSLLALARIIDPVLIEIVGLEGGFDGFWLDAEHGGVTVAQMRMAAITATAHQLDCFVRIAPSGYEVVTQCMEAGTRGVMGAQIQSLEHAAQFVSWCKFPPQGTRGLNSSGRDAEYTRIPFAEFAATANQNSLAGVQVETLGALADVEAIAKLPGLDFLFLGPADLSMAMGIVGQFHHPLLWEAIERIAAAARQAQIAWGAVVPDPEFARRCLELGCQLPTYGNDATLLRKGIQATRQLFQLD